MAPVRHATLRHAISFVAPSEIHSRGYRAGCIDENKLVCCDHAGVFVFDLASGELLRQVAVAGGSSIRRIDRGYVVDVKTSTSSGRLIHLPFDDAPRAEIPYSGHIKSWSSDRTEVALFNEGTLEVRRWPDLEVIHAVQGYHPTIDWANRLLLVSDVDNHRHVIESMDAVHERRYVAYGELEPQFFYVVGAGVADVNHGFELVGYLSGWRTKLYPDPPSDGSLALELTRDRRSLRTVVGNRPCRFDIDFSTGALLTSLPAIEEGQPTLSKQLWNPKVDVIVLEDDESEALCDLDGTILVRLPPGAEAKQWFDDGRALLVTYPTDDEPLQIDVWRFAE